jgi:transposase
MTSRRATRYPSDLTDAQWLRLEPLLPPGRAVGRHRTVSLRDVANAINYRWETGCVWRMLPHDFPAWGTVYSYFRAWQRAGVIRQLREILLESRQRSVSRLTSDENRNGFPSPLSRADRDPSASDPAHGSGHNEQGFSSPTDRGGVRPSLTSQATTLPDRPPA